MAKRKAKINTDRCVACGCCAKDCPKGAISIYRGIYAIIEKALCIGCSRCSAVCPANAVVMGDTDE